MKTSWTRREFLIAATLIGVVVIVLAAYAPASQAAKRNHAAMQVLSTQTQVIDPDLHPGQAPVKGPSVRILQPADQTHYWYGDAIPVRLVVSAQDGNHDAIPDSSIVWTDNREGVLGTGATLQHVFLSGDTHSQHIITATAMTVSGKSASDTITIEIGFTQ
jgi:hypothetical protein